MKKLMIGGAVLALITAGVVTFVQTRKNRCTV